LTISLTDLALRFKNKNSKSKTGMAQIAEAIMAATLIEVAKSVPIKASESK
jgi:hypothetical protein